MKPSRWSTLTLGWWATVLVLVSYRINWETWWGFTAIFLLLFLAAGAVGEIAHRIDVAYRHAKGDR